MRVVFRGGPKNRERAEVKDYYEGIELVKPVEWRLSDQESPEPIAAFIKGRYSRTIRPNKQGVYYMIWMGWDE